MCVFVVLSISLVLLMVSIKIKEKRSSRRFKAIPGPRGWPIVGNIGLKPEIFPQQFKEIGDSHGSMFQLQILNKTFIVIQCPQILHEIFENGEQCVNRPNYFFSENIFSGKDLAFGDFDEHRQKLKELLLKIIYKTPDLSEVTRQGVSCGMKTFYTDILKTKGRNFNPDVPMKTFICDCFQLICPEFQYYMVSIGEKRIILEINGKEQAGDNRLYQIKRHGAMVHSCVSAFQCSTSHSPNYALLENENAFLQLLESKRNLAKF